MQGIEKTLRDTLAKMGNADGHARLKLYVATENILERSLSAFAESQPEMVEARRAELKQVIANIEADYNASGISSPVASPTATSIASPAASPVASPVVAPATELATKPVTEPATELATKPTTSPIQSAPQVQPPQAPSETIAPDFPQPTHAQAANIPEIKPATTSGLGGDLGSNSESQIQWPDAATQTDHHSAHNAEVEQAFPVAEPDLANSQANTQKEYDFPVADTIVVDDKKALRKERAAQKKAERAERRQEKRQKRRRGGFIDAIASGVVSIIFILFLVVGAWYFVESEYYDMLISWQNGEQTEPQVSETVADDGQGFIPKPLNENATQSSDWFELFGSNNLTSVQGRGEVIVETGGDNVTGGVRITSVNSSEFGEAVVPLNAQILQGAETRKIALAFAMSVDEPTQIYIRCFLKNGVEMDRRRFQLTGGRNDLIVNLDMSNVSRFDQRPFVTINSDIVGQGRSVELYDIKYQIIE